jgi:putative DNA primase/helicase
MAAKSAGLSFDAFHEWSTGGENYKNQQDCITVWRSFKETGGITLATLYDEAFRQGWKANGAARPKIANVSHAPHDPVKIPDNPAPKTWEMCILAPPDHPYIVRKRGNPDGLRIYPDNAPPLIINKQEVAGWLAVPVWFEGQLQTIQFIPPNIDGKKLNCPGASANDGYFTVGNLPDNSEYSGEICIVEGIGQAWAAKQTRGTTTIPSFSGHKVAMI